jgi:hypothetical protein
LGDAICVGCQSTLIIVQVACINHGPAFIASLVMCAIKVSVLDGSRNWELTTQGEYWDVNPTSWKKHTQKTVDTQSEANGTHATENLLIS